MDEITKYLSDNNDMSLKCPVDDVLIFSLARFDKDVAMTKYLVDKFCNAEYDRLLSLIRSRVDYMYAHYYGKYLLECVIENSDVSNY